jgi:LPS export ABC transporter protein LptC
MIQIDMVCKHIPAIILAGMCFSCSNDLDRVAALEMPSTAPDRVTLNAEYVFTDSGMVRNILHAGRIEEYKGEQPRTELADGVKLEFFDPKGGPGSVLTARRGSIRPDQKKMEVFDDVVFVNSKGERMETEYLLWLQDSARVRTDRAVRVLRGEDIIHGKGLDASQDFSNYTIRQVTGVLQVSEGDTLAP